MGDYQDGYDGGARPQRGDWNQFSQGTADRQSHDAMMQRMRDDAYRPFAPAPGLQSQPVIGNDSLDWFGIGASALLGIAIYFGFLGGPEEITTPAGGFILLMAGMGLCAKLG